MDHLLVARDADSWGTYPFCFQASHTVHVAVVPLGAWGRTDVVADGRVDDEDERADDPDA